MSSLKVLLDTHSSLSLVEKVHTHTHTHTHTHISSLHGFWSRWIWEGIALEDSESRAPEQSQEHFMRPEEEKQPWICFCGNPDRFRAR
ncbi:hypothetical protein R3I93_020035 [Phoxinus phoxinus]|uniref:Uncharacterized protein n=1 Tax=Phoxinus phoxinus TaxID=58324 RepID=A0AAN9GST2_9TELE